MAFDSRRMGFFDHLDEFRKRLGVVLVAVLVGAVVAYVFSLDAIRFLVAPLGLKTLTVLSPMESFVLRFKVAVYMAIVVTSPVWIYELLAFITPALKPKERKWFFPGLLALIFFFLLGNVFCYLYILGPSFAWMIAQGGEMLSVLPKATEYVNFVVYFLLGFGLAFETPVIVIVLVKLGVVKADAILRQWRWAVVIIMIVASIATPDWSPVTMGALSIAMLILYFGAALVARFL